MIPEEHWEKALKLLYAEKFDWSRLVYDITYTSIGAAVVEDFYDENVVFLRFCFEKELLKKNPLDRQGRILRTGRRYRSCKRSYPHGRNQQRVRSH